MTTVYVSSRCPNCTRLVKTIRRLQLPGITLIDVDHTPVNGLKAVPTVVDTQGSVMVGTQAFEWLQGHEARLPLEAYATTLGAGDGGLSYTDLETDETVEAALFTSF